MRSKPPFAWASSTAVRNVPGLPSSSRLVTSKVSACAAPGAAIVAPTVTPAPTMIRLRRPVIPLPFVAPCVTSKSGTVSETADGT